MPRSVLEATYPQRIGQRTVRITFRFTVEKDPMTRMHYVEAKVGQRSFGHFDFTINNGWMLVQYGTFATSEAETYSDYSSCLKSPAIESNLEFRKILRGLGSVMVVAALSWGKRAGLLGMKIIQPRTPDFWRKLKFAPEGEDLAFYFATQPLPRIRLRQKVD